MDVWICCQCRSPNHIANSPERCPVCSHYRDSYCRIGRTVSAGAVQAPNVQYYRTMPPPTIPGPAAHISATSVARSGTSGFYQMSKPLDYWSVSSSTRSPTMAAHSMSGWWICHCCNNLNNPKLCAGRCICGHDRCASCAPAMGRL